MTPEAEKLKSWIESAVIKESTGSVILYMSEFEEAHGLSIDDPFSYKVCPVCLIGKDISAFGRRYSDKPKDRYNLKGECKECASLRFRKWRKDNPEKASITATVANHRRRGAGAVSGSVLRTLQAGPQYCANPYCRKPLWRMSWEGWSDNGHRDSEAWIEHLIPVARGGSGEEGNLTVTCRGCNVKKNAKTWEEFLAQERETQT